MRVKASLPSLTPDVLQQSPSPVESQKNMAQSCATKYTPSSYSSTNPGRLLHPLRRRNKHVNPNKIPNRRNAPPRTAILTHPLGLQRHNPRRSSRTVSSYRFTHGSN